MTFWVLVVLQMTTGFVAGAARIGKYPEGQKALENLSHSGLFFLKWRAYANFKSELRTIRNAIGWLGLVSGASLLAFGATPQPSLFNAMPGACIVLWFMLEFGVNFRKSVREQFSLVGLFLIAPWLILVLEILSPNARLLQTMAEPLGLLGIVTSSSYQAALAVSLVGAAMALVMACATVLLFSILPLFLLFVLVATSKISRAVLKVSEQTAYNLAVLYFYVFGPIFIALEAKGYI